MSVRLVYVPILHKHVKLGRRPAVARGPRLRLSSYLLKALPPVPASFDYSPAAARSLSNVYLNDQLGCCVVSCGAHLEGVLSANAGNPELVYSDDQIVHQYSAIGGYVQGDPSTDQGCNEQDALNYWRQHGFAGGTPFSGSLAVNPKDPVEYAAALYLFENLVYGIGLPNQWLENPAPGFVWDAAPPNARNGHCILAVGREPGRVKVATWGFTGWLTDAAHAADVDELYVVLSPDQIGRALKKAPSGLNWTQLVSDFDSMGGHVPVPVPDPVPVPPPTPGPTPPGPEPAPTPPPPPAPPPVTAGPTLGQVEACDEDVFRRLRQAFARVRGAGSVLNAAETALFAEHAALFGPH
jgi:hypothetical protein